MHPLQAEFALLHILSVSPVPAALACSGAVAVPETPPASPHSSGNTPRPSSPIEATKLRILHIPSDPSANSSSVPLFGKSLPWRASGVSTVGGARSGCCGGSPRRAAHSFGALARRRSPLISRNAVLEAWELQPACGCTAVQRSIGLRSERVPPSQLRIRELKFTGYSFQQCMCQQKDKPPTV